MAISPTLRRLLDEGLLKVQLEPVVSIRQNAVVGYEAKCPVPDGCALEVHRLVRNAGLEAYRLQGPHRGLLFLGLDNTDFHWTRGGPLPLVDLVQEFHLSPSDVVLSLREPKGEHPKTVSDFVAAHRAEGFLIALQGMGEGHFSIERLALVRPDVLKLSFAAARSSESEFVNQEIVKALVGLSRKIGALVVAEEVSEETQALSALEWGVDMLQGPYWPLGEPFEGRMAEVAARLKNYTQEKAREASARIREHEILLGQLAKILSHQERLDVQEALERVAPKIPWECLFVLNEKGVQVSDTVAGPKTVFKRSSLFHPARKGADHSAKEYFYLLNDTFIRRYRTEPYVSLATGNLCMTFSELFKDPAGRPRILCLDVPLEEER